MTEAAGRTTPRRELEVKTDRNAGADGQHASQQDENAQDQDRSCLGRVHLALGKEANNANTGYGISIVV